MSLKDYDGCFVNPANLRLTNKILGHGSYGVVYVIKNIKDQKDYALKIINAEGEFDESQQYQLMIKSIGLSQLSNPGIARFIGVNFQSFRDSTKFETSILTDYYPNGSLRDILDNENKSIPNELWTPTKKYITLLGLAKSMSYLHQNKIIHGDLKPENILYDQYYNPHVSDYGFSMFFPKTFSQYLNLTIQGQFNSSILYMAPELISSKNKYTSSIDVYSFAMIAYELLTGKAPFFELGNSNTPSQFIKKVSSGYRPQFMKGTTEKMQKLLSKAPSLILVGNP